ncbi:hypothetical protein BGX34_004184, partial [Mortierella sp. NVP85]
YSWALKAQGAKKNIIQSDSIRYACSFLLCAAWLASPSYGINSLLVNLRKYALEDQFFKLWACGNLGAPMCRLRFGIDICCFLMALFVFLEVILAHLNGRSPDAHRADTLPTTAVVASDPVQQYPVQPVQQFAYHPVQQQQPGLPPAAYYPQPVMYQTPTMPYQVSHQAPASQPYPIPA